MVETASLLPIADVLKLFGNNGTLIVKFRPNAQKLFKETEPVFALMDGIPVPFYMASCQPRGNDRADLLFDTIYREAQARELVGKTLYQPAPKRKSSKSRQQGFQDPNLLTGFTVSDTKKGPVGTVEQFLDWDMNPCLSIRRDQPENAEPVLVPFNEAFIVEIDLQARHILLALPDGLIELY